MSNRDVSASDGACICTITLESTLLSQNLFLQSPGLLPVIPVVVSLDLLLKLLHLLRLPLPFCLAHLRFSTEQFIIRLPIATTQSVPQRSELPIVVVEVQVVHCVACSAVEEVGIGYVFAVICYTRLAAGKAP